MWACTLACYTSTFLQQGGKDVEGTYVWTPFIPLEEADKVPTLQGYLDGVGGLDKATSWGVGAWGAGLAFQQVVNDIVAADGPNGVTRAKILEGMNKLKADGFKGDGMYGDGTYPGGPPKCMVIMQVQNGKFVRVVAGGQGHARLLRQQPASDEPRPDDAVQGLSSRTE